MSKELREITKIIGKFIEKRPWWCDPNEPGPVIKKGCKFSKEKVHKFPIMRPRVK